jgi:putative transposase
VIRELRPKYPMLSVTRMCQLLRVPRSLVYRKVCDRPERARFYRELTFEIGQVLSSNPGYGYRRVRRDLAKLGRTCGYKSVRRAMREGSLQRRRRRPRIRTSDGKGHGNYPNLLKHAKIDAPGQAWVADITYIGIPGGTAYLACVLDVYLRKIVGSAMSRRIDTQLTLRALRQALASHTPEPGWIHHSDRGSQYGAGEYAQAVLQNGGRMSWSEKGCPEDNAFMESFYKTLKAEEVWLESYDSMNHADRSISRFIDYYNTQRMHSSLNYMSPKEFETRFRNNDQSR